MIIAVIPARGGSERIRNKNLRQFIDDSLVGRAIDTAQQSRYIAMTYVSSDDPAILRLARERDAFRCSRPARLSMSDTTISEVIHHFVTEQLPTDIDMEKLEAIVTLQPTSPLRTRDMIDTAIQEFEEVEADSLVSVYPQNKFMYRISDVYEPIPLFRDRVNSQNMDVDLVENGAIFISRPSIITRDSHIGGKIHYYRMEREDSIDVDTWADWRLARILAASRNILIIIRANQEVGYGHYYRAMEIVRAFNADAISMLVLDADIMFRERIAQYCPILCDCVGMPTVGEYLWNNTALRTKYDLIINDCLDTGKPHMRACKSRADLVVNFEDAGDGAEMADILFNSLYPRGGRAKEYVGADYAILRPEFLFLDEPHGEVEVYRPVDIKGLHKVLVTFGGTDPNDITGWILNTIATKLDDLLFEVILGPGYDGDRLPGRPPANVRVVEAVANMAERMLDAGVVLTSGGRTIFEAAACGRPVIAICQNYRELTHTHLSAPGVTNLGAYPAAGLGDRLVKRLMSYSDCPLCMMEDGRRIRETVDGLGIYRVAGIIERELRRRDR